jgi:LysR family transcriptional regulator, mexEF-oprN operon transcriptional activator
MTNTVPLCGIPSNIQITNVASGNAGSLQVNENNFKNVNLNLLVVFAVLMRERSITRAAKTLGLSQPAVSNSLKRLRALFGDELFTRVSQGVVPTDRAHSLYQNLLPSLEAIETTLNEQRNLEPAAQKHVFRAGLSGAVSRPHVYIRRSRGRSRRGSA